MDAETSRAPGTTFAGPMDAIALLVADHRAVEKLFAGYEAAVSAEEKMKLSRQICLELCVHTAIEEELLYPACRGVVDDGVLDEAYVEHDGAKQLLAQLMEGSLSDEFYDAKIKVLSELIKHHVEEEEQRDGLFAQAKASDIDLMALGGRLAKLAQELKHTYLEDGLPQLTTHTSNGTKLDGARNVGTIVASGS